MFAGRAPFGVFLTGDRSAANPLPSRNTINTFTKFKHISHNCILKMSKINFPKLVTLRLAIRTTYILFVQLLFSIIFFLLIFVYLLYPARLTSTSPILNMFRIFRATWTDLSVTGQTQNKHNVILCSQQAWDGRVDSNMCANFGKHPMKEKHTIESERRRENGPSNYNFPMS